MTCEHYRKPCPFAGGAEDGAWVCHRCSKNTARGVWPEVSSLPLIQIITVKGEIAPPALFNPIPRKQWPELIKQISDLQADGDTGVGDTVHRELGSAGTAIKVILKAAGVACGCDTRRNEWNQKYPYEVPT